MANHRVRTRLSLMGMALAVVPLVARGSAVAADVNYQVEHWGSVFTTVPSRESSTLTRPTPITLPGAVNQVATSNSTEYALLSNGSVYAWGLGGEGQLGDGSTADSLNAAVEVDFPAGVTIASLAPDAMPYDAGLALDTTGHAWGWGYGVDGALCLGKVQAELAPVELPFSDVTALAGAGDHAIYDADGTVYACGENHQGDLGIGTTTASKTPAEVTALSGMDVKALYASCDDSGALLTNGTYYDWGNDADGQLGDGTIGTSSDTPVKVNLPLPVTQVALGGSDPENGQTLVELSDGSFRAWGDDEHGELGDGGTSNHASPIVFTPPAGVTFQIIASGGATCYAVSTSNGLYAWGQGGSGQIGNGTTHDQPTPLEVETGVSHVSVTAQDVVTD